MIDEIKKTREYLDYLEEHYNNVQKAWKEFQEKCSDLKYVSNEFLRSEIHEQVYFHDSSKMSQAEFVPYRKNFFPTITEKKPINNKDFDLAWENHKKENTHHWQSWVNLSGDPEQREINIIHNVIDWMAMGYKFGDTAKSFYEKEKSSGEISIPEESEKFMYEIFNRLYGV